MDITRLQIKVLPGAKKDAVLGWQDDILRLKIRAAPIEGAANKAALDFLASKLNLKRSQLELIRGDHHREKVIEVRGLGIDAIKALLKT